MKKKMLIVALGLALVMGTAACGNSEDATTEITGSTEAGQTLQQEIVKFVGTDLPSIAADRDKAVEIYNAYFKAGNDQDSEKWMNTLQNDALPKYDTYIKNLKGLPFVHAEVGELKDLYAASAELQRGAIKDVIEAITNVDSRLLESAQKKVEQSQKKLDEYNKKLKALCEENNISLEGIDTASGDKAGKGATEAATQAATQAATEAATEAAQ